jgi:hypothetical protein
MCVLAFLGGPMSALAKTANSLPSESWSVRLATTWRLPSGAYEVGVLQAQSGQALTVVSRVPIPTRAHAVIVEPKGTLLAVARRPGDWLMRLTPQGRVVQKQWIEPDRAFNGHVWASADGRTLCTSETDLSDGQGLLGVRDARTLQKLREWKTHGMDPHAFQRDAEGHWMVANGGIPTLPETGRLKINLSQMDASLVRLHRDSGELLGQWRLDDPRMSLRHMAWSADRKTLGLALQSEHDDAQRKAAAPVLAWFDAAGRGSLRTAPQAENLAGYAGDIAAVSVHTWVVSCPKANRAAWWRGGRWAGTSEAPGVCALLPSQPDRLWLGGADAAHLAPHADVSSAETSSIQLPGIELDNHWVSY